MGFSNIIAGLAVAAAAVQGGFLVTRERGTTLFPPGSQGEKDFLSRCVKCGKCMQACPYAALHPAPASAGLAMGAPCIDAREQACRLCEDFPCVAACPTGALRDVERRSDVRMGVAVIDEDTCLSFQGMRCEVCYRACPLIDEAITIDYRMREGDAIHSLFAPIVDDQKCVGCGLCVERCVVSDPAPAIRIVPEYAANRGAAQEGAAQEDATPEGAA